MKHVLISFVGNQDPCSPHSQEEGSVVTLCRHVKPDHIYLLPTAALPETKSSTEQNALDTKEWLTECLDHPSQSIEINPLPLYHPDEYEDVLLLTRRVLLSIINSWQDQDVQLHLNTSSGTPAMKGSMFVLAEIGLLPRIQLWKVADPRYIAKPEERVVALRSTFLEEEKLLSRLQNYAATCSFQNMAEECRRLQSISLYPDRRYVAETLGNIFQSYHHWDLIQYREASQLLSSAYRQLSTQLGARNQRSLLQKQVTLLEELNRSASTETAYNLLDLCYNAQRRMLRGDYTDTLSRFWRFYEGCLYYQLQQVYQIKHRQWRTSTNSEAVTKISRYLENNASASFPTLNRSTAQKILKDVLQDSTLLDLLNTNYPGTTQLISHKIDKLVESRNDSIAAHGMCPVEQKEAQTALTIMQLLAENVLQTKVAFAEYPLQPNHVSNLLQLLDLPSSQ